MPETHFLRRTVQIHALTTAVVVSCHMKLERLVGVFCHVCTSHTRQRREEQDDGCSKRGFSGFVKGSAYSQRCNLETILEER